MHVSTSGAWRLLFVELTSALSSAPSVLRWTTRDTLPLWPGCFLPQRSKQPRNLSRFALKRSISGWTRSLAPASPEVIALLSTTPPSGSLVISLWGGPGGDLTTTPLDGAPEGALPGS